MELGFEQLIIDEEFRTLIRPLRRDEYQQLEINLSVDGCRDPIITWNHIIIDGHNRYEICNRRHIPYAVTEMEFDSRKDAIIWICTNQLGRRNITEETRKYLIGKQYELEKMHGKQKNVMGFNRYRKRGRPELPETETYRRTAQKLSRQYHVSTGAVQKYAIYSKAIDTISDADAELSDRVLNGTYKISHENLVALSKMPPEEIRKMSAKQQKGPARQFVSYKESRKDFMSKELPGKENGRYQEELPAIKTTPAYDPDAEITGLTLTVPSWVSSIERARQNSNLAHVSQKAKRNLEAALQSLQDKISEMLSDIKEGRS